MPGILYLKNGVNREVVVQAAKELNNSDEKDKTWKADEV